MIPVIVAFIIWFFLEANKCSCKKQIKDCSRTEFYGFQYAHFFFFIFLGFMYPDQFWFWIILGALWELFEYWLSKNPKIVNQLGGCLSKEGDKGPLWMRKVYGNEQKYENFIDKQLGIKNSTEHKWHYSVGENLTNILGFLLGRYLKTI